jgi:2-C-methyl-D-erythritol 4-phosphate cytidylyltransferase / 2-C-methyl-D-erythritol 2,4-cyclodiphosphate synthase
MARSAGIIAAAGSGERLGAKLPKALVQIAGRTLVEHAFSALSPVVDFLVITAPLGFENEYKKLFGDSAVIVTGGATRSSSVNLALAALPEDIEFILVHDAARSFASTALAKKILDQLESGERAVVPALAVSDTIKHVDESGYVIDTPERSALRAVQTPQGFQRDLLLQAHMNGAEGSDDAALVEALGVKVKVIAGEAGAFKITTKEDIGLAYQFIGSPRDREFKVGIGVDAHAFSSDPSRKMFLAALTWENEIGVEGHSDGDVASHAICDALLSAASLGDLGSNFGVSDPRYAGASGELLLRETLSKIEKSGFTISHVSVQIVANRPKIGPRRSEAIAAISAALGGASVSVSATTTDGLGFTGEGRGISAIATALIYRS